MLFLFWPGRKKAPGRRAPGQGESSLKNNHSEEESLLPNGFVGGGDPQVKMCIRDRFCEVHNLVPLYSFLENPSVTPDGVPLPGLRHPASAALCLRLAGRGPNSDSLFPPLAAVVVVAPNEERPWHGGKLYLFARGSPTRGAGCEAD